MITVHVIHKANASRSSTIDVSPLQKCVDKLKVVAKRYDKQGKSARLVQFRIHGDDIQKLRTSIEAVVAIMGLAAGFNNADKLQEILVRLGLGVNPMFTYRLYCRHRGE